MNQSRWRTTVAPGESGPVRKIRLTPEERTALQIKRLQRRMDELSDRLEKVEQLAQGTSDELTRPLTPEEAKQLLEEAENEA